MSPCRSPAPAPASGLSACRRMSWPASRRSSFPGWPATKAAPAGWAMSASMRRPTGNGAAPTGSRAFSVLASLSTSDMGGVEPFGFRDGISQPKIDWAGERHATPDAETEYGNLVALGEFVLGYPNEYGQYTDRPLLDPAADPGAALPPAAGLRGMHDLGRNGTYLVLRDLRQDVRGFWQYLDKPADGSAEIRRKLAQAMVGREISGTPLLPPATRPI